MSNFILFVSGLEVFSTERSESIKWRPVVFCFESEFIFEMQLLPEKTQNKKQITIFIELRFNLRKLEKSDHLH